jgi:Ni/Fe-hydrogenase 1 B-type cytochrome subunit
VQILLAIINIWADVLAAIIIASGATFTIFQITGNFVSGRFQKKFRDKLWPKHEEIIPVLPRILHAVHALSIIALGISGYCIRFPFYTVDYAVMLQVHYYFVYPVVVTFIFRVYYAILKDAKEFKIHPFEAHNSLRVVMYYTFIKTSYPHLFKYNILQKMTYSVLFPVLMVILATSGFSLMWPQILLGWSAVLFGTLPTAIALTLVIHWIAAISIIAITMVHVCLAFVEDYPALLVFFGLSRQRDGYRFGKTNGQI